VSSADLNVTTVQGAVVFRVDVAQLETLGPGVVNVEYFAVDARFGPFGGLGAAQRCDGRAFWAAHMDNTTMRIYWWDDFVNKIGVQDVTIPGWRGGWPDPSLTPDGSNWLSFEYGRITGARVQSGSVVFGWTAASNPNRPHPYIYLAQFNQTPGSDAISVGGVRDIWHTDFAWAMPTLGTNSPGRLAMTCAYGGGAVPPFLKGRFVATTVGFVDFPISNTSRYDAVTTAVGTAGADRWGDFMSLRNHDQNDRLFLATGYTVHNEERERNTINTIGVPRFVIFGDSES
jgi:hypothetical protein